MNTGNDPLPNLCTIHTSWQPHHCPLPPSGLPVLRGALRNIIPTTQGSITFNANPKRREVEAPRSQTQRRAFHRTYLYLLQRTFRKNAAQPWGGLGEGRRHSAEGGLVILTREMSSHSSRCCCPRGTPG